jgi:predicted phage terminase large subunit-like protein
MGLRRNTKDRKVPSESDRVYALFSIKRFADLIYFHGGMTNFGQIHHEGLDWTESRIGTEVTRELILMPRSHLKTTVFTVLDVLHNIYINPNIRCYIGSANQNLSKAILREITANLVDPWLQEYVWNVRPHFDGRLIPLMDAGAKQRRMVRLEESGEFSDFEESALEYADDKKKIWRQDAIQVIRSYKLKEPTVVIGSVDSPATGFHYDRIYFDDIINFDNYDKPEKIERLDTWRNDMFSVLDDNYQDEDLYDSLKQVQFKRKGITIEDARKRSQVGGFCRTVGTRYFKHDWYKQIIDASNIDENDVKWDTWVRNIYTNSEDSAGGYLWKERWSSEIEKRKRSEMTRKHFYAQYLNKVIVDEDQVIPIDKIKGIQGQEIQFVGHNSSRIYIEKEKGTRVEIALHFCIDPAATCTPDADFTAFGVGGKDSEGNLYIVELLVMKKTSDGWIRKMYEVLDKWNLKAVHLETVAFASELKNTIRLKFNKEGFYPISVRDYKPGVRTNKKERIESGLEPLIANGMLYLTASAFRNSEIQDQFNFFPSNTVKDDAPDVVQMVNEVSKKTQPLSKVVPINKNINNRWGGFY